jgi:Xaa-Pro aminopeptidase
MFEPQIYIDRRHALAAAVGDGAILLPGAQLRSRNYADNVYPFRQSSHLLYYTGLNAPDLFVLLWADEDRAVLYGRERTMDDVVWCGERPSLDELADGAGLDEVRHVDTLGADLRSLALGGTALHYLPPFHGEGRLLLSGLLGRSSDEIADGVSRRLIAAVAEQRLVKSDAEIDQIEAALAVTAEMYRAAMRAAGPGLTEADIAGIIEGVALRANCVQSFPPITSVRGEVLHNESRSIVLEAGQLLLVDSGAELANGYTSDITRTMPVSGKFDPRQRAIYQSVLDAQLEAIAHTRPGVRYANVHRRAVKVLAARLVDVGLMKGDPDDIVTAGAHALLMPHGLGHAMGLDVHDMEDLGDAVGYGTEGRRATQFGLNFLRFARTLQPGHVVTAEPGVYFIPALIDQWAAEGRHAEFIDYGALQAYKGFGGIRIEDDVLVTSDGARVLGPGIPKTVDDVEATMAAGD